MPPNRSRRSGKKHPGLVLGAVVILLGLLYGGMFLSGRHAPKLGLDLQGGSSVTLTPKFTESGNKDLKTALNQSVNIIRQRVNGLGVSEADVTTEGNNIVVSVPGKKQNNLLALVGQTAQLRFRQVCLATPNGGPLPTKPEAQPCPGANNTGTVQAGPKPSDALLTKFQTLDCTDPKAQARISVPDQPDDQMVVACGKDGEKYLLTKTLLKGDEVKTASAGLDQDGITWLVQLEFTGQGAKDWAKLTADANIQTYGDGNPNAQVAIVLDGIVESAPQTRESIPGGKAQISGSFTHKSASDLANVLKYGALPITLQAQDVVQVSPTLGSEQLRAGLIAGAIGIALVVIYSFLYYRGLGFITILSLGMSAAMLWPIICILGETIGFTLSLAGVAGLIMAIGVTVDSFVVYFEYLRDELREGRTVRSAVDRGWTRARRTIVSADAVSLIGAAILYWLSIGNVRGFAFTMGLSTAVDLVIIFFVTKPLLSLLSFTKFYGEGHRWSGLNPAHVGVKRRVSVSERLLLGKGA